MGDLHVSCRLKVSTFVRGCLRLRPNASGEFDSEIRIFSNPFSRVEKINPQRIR